MYFFGSKYTKAHTTMMFTVLYTNLCSPFITIKTLNAYFSQTFFIFHYTELCTAAYLDKWGWKALPFPFENHVNGKMDKVPLVL